MKKIMFNDKYGLTAAVLKGEKTMTRRIILDEHGLYNDLNAANKLYIHKDNTLRIDFGNCIERKVIIPYKVGEIVAVAQAYKHIVGNHYFQEQCLANETDALLTRFDAGWDNKMFVKSYYMPNRIRITDIKIERLQDISNEDCLNEGITDCNVGARHFGFSDIKAGHWQYFYSPKEAFAHLIDKVSGNGTWESNPWVFVYSFELIK